MSKWAPRLPVTHTPWAGSSQVMHVQQPREIEGEVTVTAGVLRNRAMYRASKIENSNGRHKPLYPESRSTEAQGVLAHEPCFVTRNKEGSSMQGSGYNNGVQCNVWTFWNGICEADARAAAFMGVIRANKIYDSPQNTNMGDNVAVIQSGACTVMNNSRYTIHPAQHVYWKPAETHEPSTLDPTERAKLLLKPPVGVPDDKVTACFVPVQFGVHGHRSFFGTLVSHKMGQWNYNFDTMDEFAKETARMWTRVTDFAFFAENGHLLPDEDDVPAKGFEPDSNQRPWFGYTDGKRGIGEKELRVNMLHMLSGITNLSKSRIEGWYVLAMRQLYKRMRSEDRPKQAWREVMHVLQALSVDKHYEFFMERVVGISQSYSLPGENLDLNIRG